MTIDIEKTQFVVFAWPDNRWPVEVQHWIELLTKNIELRPDQRVSVRKKNIVCARNYGCKLAISSDPHYEHFVFMDRDVRPGHQTAKFLRLDADVKSCQCKQRVRHAWAWPNDFHESIWCTSRKVLQAIEPPWFQHSYTSDGCDMTACLCQSFRQKVLDAGFTLAHGGWAEHDRDESWC